MAVSTPYPARVLRYLAVRLAGWPELLAYHRHGLPAAIETLGQRGATGIDDDGVWRSCSTICGPRGKISYQEEPVDAPPLRVPVRAVLEWATARITPADWARLLELETDRNTALQLLWGERDLLHRRTYRPHELTGADRERLAAGEAAQHAAEHAMRTLIDQRLRPASVGVRGGDPGRDAAPGEQLLLFS